MLLDGEDVYAMTPDRLRAVRWTSAAIVFQGALHSLNPVQRVGDQIDEAILLHTSPDRTTRARRDRVRAARAGRLPAESGARRIPTSCRAASASACSSPWRWRASQRC